MLILSIGLGAIVLLAIALAVYFLRPAPNVFSEAQLASIKAIALDRMEGIAEVLDLPVDINVTIEDLGLDGLILCPDCSGKTRNYEVNLT